MKVFTEIFLELHTQVTKTLTQGSQRSTKIHNCISRLHLRCTTASKYYKMC